MKKAFFKKSISLLLTLAMAFSLLVIALPASAAEALVFEAGDLYDAGCITISGSTAVFQDTTGNDNAEQGNRFIRMNTDATDDAKGSTMTFTLTLDKAGDYDIDVRFRAHESTSLCDFYVNDTLIGDFEGRSGYNSQSANQVYDAIYENVALNAGENTIKFVAKEKGSQSKYGVNIFRFTLTETDKTGMTGTSTVDGATLYTVGDNTGYAEFKTSYTGTSTGFVEDSSHTDGYWWANWYPNDNGEIYCYRITDGSYFKYILSVEESGTYDLSWMARGHNGSYGTFGIYVNGLEETNCVKHGVSTYNASGTEMLTLDIGSVELNAGDNEVYFVSEKTSEGYNNVFVSYALTASKGEIIEPVYNTAGYISKRTNETDSTAHDLRVVLVSNLEALASYDEVTVKVTFNKEGAQVASTEGVIGGSSERDYSLYSSVTAAGKAYKTSDGNAIYGVIITAIPEGAWDEIVVEVIGDGTTVISKGGLTADKLAD